MQKSKATSPLFLPQQDDCKTKTGHYFTKQGPTKTHVIGVRLIQLKT